MEALYLAADIGATKTNLGLFRLLSGRPEKLALVNFASCDAENLQVRINDFLQREKVTGLLRGGCIGVAGPVFRGRVEATNLGLKLDEEILGRSIGCPRLQLVNDLYATAASLTILGPEKLECLQTGAGLQGQPRAILAPGTGLGMALIVDSATKTMILPSEGGHADFAPRSEEEVELWGFLQRKYGRVSRERLLSGPGLVNIFNWCQHVASGRETTDDNPAGVVAAASAEDPVAVRALDMFISIMGAVAGDLALTGMAAGGVYLAGGIPARIAARLRAGFFLEAFAAKGRMSSWLEQVPVYLVLDAEAALYGAAWLALNR